MIQLEVCVDQIDDAIAAAAAGASRIEMNVALACAGLTPSIASCEWLTKNCPVPIVAMLRPHDYGFVYTAVEKLAMLRDCELLLATGISGIVSGAVNEAGGVDIAFVQELVALCGPKEFIFHRAFDTIPDQFLALKQLTDCCATRVLTSGGASSAVAGAKRLRDLFVEANAQIEILPAAGVNSKNAIELLNSTGCDQLHGSFRGFSELSRGPNLEDIRRTRLLLDHLNEGKPLS